MAQLPTTKSLSLEGFSEDERKVLKRLIPQLNDFIQPVNAALAGELGLEANTDSQVWDIVVDVPTDWIDLPDSSLTNGWINFPGFGTAAYRKDALGGVETKGMLKDGVIGLAMFTLPEPFWPPVERTLGQSAWNGAATVQGDTRVQAAGVVLNYSVGGVNSWVSLDGLRYEASDTSPLVPSCWPRDIPLSLKKDARLAWIGRIYDVNDANRSIAPCVPTFTFITKGDQRYMRILNVAGLAAGRKYRISGIVTSG